ncbi:MAG: hypothetical protein A2882_02385 [Phenylobacterium sp. RIFCSPHIGHO2_01_FULL_70_10]|nr:MAG: hypothetical protein A2882_02385 [Phenylobacterium sp. RIFCSPHIGHO2_01_FULL_70_10]
MELGRGRGLRSRWRHGAGLDAEETGLAVQQELAGGHHPLAFRQASQHLGLAARLPACADLGRLVTAAGPRQHDQGALARPDHGFRRDEQRRLRQAAELDRGKHAGPQATAGVRQLDSDGERAALGLRLRQDGGHPAVEGFAGKGREARRHGLAHPDLAGLGLGHRRVQPHAAEAVDLRQGLTGGHRHTVTHGQGLDHPARRHGHGDDVADAAAPRHRVDRVGGHAEQLQPLAGRLNERRVARAPHRQELALGACPFRDQQVGQRRACAHHVAGRAAVDALHEAGRLRLHDGHVALVEVDDPGCGHSARQSAALDGRGPHTEVLDLGGVDLDAARARRLVRVFRDQLHVHERRLARLVEVLAGDHGVVPVEHLAAGLGRWRAAGRGRRCQATDPEAERGGDGEARRREDEGLAAGHWSAP